MPLIEFIPPDWRAVLSDATTNSSFLALDTFVAEQRASHGVYPPRDLVFEALRQTPLNSVRAVIVGQDPYPGRGQACGLAFSVPPGVEPPASLRNILREYERDTGQRIPAGGSLVPWAQHGVLLLNEVLTVRSGQPGSHAGHGWEGFTSAVVRAVAAKPYPIAFLLWGTRAQRKVPLIDTTRHVLITGSHPSPLSAWRGFMGSAPFSRANAELVRRGQAPINWDL